MTNLFTQDLVLSERFRPVKCIKYVPVFANQSTKVGDDLDEEFGKAVDDLLAPVIVHFPLDDTQGKPADDPVGDYL